MFNPYAESLSSTGEPPTIPPGTRRNNLSSSSQTFSSGNISQQETSQLSLSSNSSRLSVQEPDSGYEASPSSIADNQRFFGEQSMAAANPSEVHQSSNANSDEEFDIVECHSQILFSGSESDELDDYDTCLDCSSSLCNCYRTDSSNTNATAISNCDNSRCNSIDLSYNRPSSQPIQIPILPSCRIRSNGQPRMEIFGALGDIYPQTRSQPVDLSPLQRLGFVPDRHPLSWPSTGSPSRNFRNLALPSPWNNVFSNRDIPNSDGSRRYNHPVRSRRQIIDSDASSFCSSDEEGPEDVFNMPTGEASSYPIMTVGSGPLPDVVLESTDSGRRSRSMSINLPPNRERTIHDIGRRLRRMSDLFEQRHLPPNLSARHSNPQFNGAVIRGRSRTTSDCDDHLRRNGVP